MPKEVSVLVGAGSIGQAIARRVGAGKITVLAAPPLPTGTETFSI